MSWSWPPAWPIGHLVLASELNTYLRDNLLETGAATVTTAGDLFVGAGANDLKRLAVGSADQILAMAAGAAGWAAVAEQDITDDDTTLTNLTATTSYAQWGSEEAAVADPGTQVTLIGFLCGQADLQSSSGLRNGFVKIEYSTDGGSTWTSLEEYTVSQYALGGQYHWLSMLTYAKQVTPTGQIQLRAQGYEGTSCEAIFTVGRLMLLVLDDS